jgi:hypothetical protein
LKAIYTAPTAEAGMLQLEAFADKWDEKYEYISRSWLETWRKGGLLKFGMGGTIYSQLMILFAEKLNGRAA